MTPLRQRLIDDLRLRNYSPRTIEAYVAGVARFAKHFGRSPEVLGSDELRAFQLHLLERHVSWSQFNQIVCALRFCYAITLRRPDQVPFIPFGKRPRTLPTVLSPQEVATLLQAADPRRDRVLLQLAYACGLRLNELLHLQVGDLDSSRMVVHIRLGKGQKDRLVPLSTKLLQELRDYWRRCRPCWRSCRPGFFLPVRVLSRVFRSQFVAGLRTAHDRGELRFPGRLASQETATAWKALLATLVGKEWVVYAKPPFGGPAQVLKYLARYTHRVAVSNSRLVELHDGRVTFRYKDYTAAGRDQLLTLSAEEFLRRFLQHVLPKGFVKVRHYGLLANRHRADRLQVSRRLLVAATVAGACAAAATAEVEPAAKRCCPACGSERLVYLPLPETVAEPDRPAPAVAADSS